MNLSPEMENFRRAIQSELIRRCEKNPNYSLRSLAKALEVDASSLSKVLHGTRGLSHKKRDEWSKKLGISMAAISPDFPEVSSYAAHQFSLDTFAIIADWYHHAITQLMGLRTFKQDTTWISRTLGITKHEVCAAVERLIRVEIIKLNKNGEWILDESNMSTTSNAFTHAAFRKFQKQVLLKAVDAMEEISIDQRDQSSMTMRMNSQRMNEAKELTKKFRRDFCKHFENDPKCDAVYQLGISFYPLTK